VVRLLVRLIVGLLAFVGLGVVAAGLVLWRSGISARTPPGTVETALARRLRSIAIPADAKDRKNPSSPTAEVLEAGMAHFADHCAICHSNNGSGDTEVGRALYPRAPDMRLDATQSLTDGELFYIIENGIRFTGMPAWAHEGEQAGWQLVHFIRRLPKLTKEELERMAGMNPKSPEEWREEEDARRSLEGKGKAPPKPAATRHKH
jgi:mono/diheme cytochrome c family protein